jgi:hypothetical protein
MSVEIPKSLIDWLNKLAKPTSPEYAEYSGKYNCQECGIPVTRARFWYNESKDMTWKCSEGHLSKVSLRKPSKAEVKARYVGEK